ncbi:hypothetical protein BVY03_01320 [bacterium K02(2017)]|nr:hypothetical protein BVY03_01320 [bacterium K02(2017)]
MHRPFSLILLIIFIAVSATASADPLKGIYNIEGWAPGADIKGPSNYKGQLAIVNKGLNYEVAWTINNEIHGGIGIYNKRTKTLSVGYADLTKKHFGVVVYKVKGPKIEGVYAPFKGEVQGKEIGLKEDSL